MPGSSSRRTSRGRGLGRFALVASLVPAPCAADRVPPRPPSDVWRVPPASFVAGTPAARDFTLDEPLPPQPWVLPRPLALDGTVRGPMLRTSRDELLVSLSGSGLGAVHRLVALDRDGRIARTFALDEPARDSLPLAEGLDGRIYLVSDATVRRLMIEAPDGTARAAIRTATAVAGPFVRSDGAVQLVTQPTARSTNGAVSAELVVFDVDGRTIAATALPGRLWEETHAWRDGRGGHWLVTAGGVVHAAADGSVHVLDDTQGVRDAAPVGADRIATALTSTVQIRTREGRIVAVVDIGAQVAGLSPLPGDRVAVRRGSNPPSIWIVGADGAVTARLAPPPSTVVATFGDASGAVLLVAQNGVLSAFEPGGAARWTLDLHCELARNAVALPGGGIAVVVAGSVLRVLLVH